MLNAAVLLLFCLFNLTFAVNDNNDVCDTHGDCGTNENRYTRGTFEIFHSILGYGVVLASLIVAFRL